MQMILESDAVLDVKSNMSTVEEIQIHKKECHDIVDDSSKMLCSLSKNVENNTDGKNEAVCDIGNDLASEHINNKNTEADNSNPDLNDLISDQNNLESTNVDVHDMGDGHLEKEIINKTEEIVEEDCLEDDIISIRIESFQGVSETPSSTEKDITENDEAILLEENLLNENTIETDKEIIDLSHDQINCDLSSEKLTEMLVETETEVIEPKDAKHAGDNCDKEIKSLVNEKAEELKEDALLDTIPCVKETEASNQKQCEQMDFIDKTQVSTGHCDEETEKEIKEKNVDEHLAKTQVNEETEIITVNDTIDQCNDSCAVETQAQQKMEIDDVISENELIISQHNIDTKTEVQEEIKEVCFAEETKFANVSKEAEETEVVELIEKPKDTAIPCEKDTEAEVMEVDDCDELTNQEAATEDPCVHELDNESESLQENSNKAVKVKESQGGSCLQIEGLIKSDENHSDPCENKLDSIGEEKQNSNNIREKDTSANMDTSVEEIQVENENKTVTVDEVICISDQREDKSTISSEATDGDKNLCTKILPNECENKTSSPTKIDVTTTKSTITEPHENETSKSGETKTDISNTDKLNSPEVIENVSDSKEHIIETKDNLESMSLDVEEVVEQISNNNKSLKDVNEVSSNNSNTVENAGPSKSDTVSINNTDNLIACKSSYTLDIFSDDEDLPEEKSIVETPQIEYGKVKQCFNIDDDDDIMLIDEDTNKPDEKVEKQTDNKNEITKTMATENTDTSPIQENGTALNKIDQQEKAAPVIDVKDTTEEIVINEKVNESKTEKPKEQGPLLPANFLSTAKTKLADMTHEDLEEFCILKIVESIVDRTSLSNIKNKLKEMGQGLEEYRKKAALLTRQNRDLQVVLKSVQEEQKKVNRDTPITPLKITRSVGVQVYMEKAVLRKKVPQQNANNKNINTPQNKNTNSSQGRVATPTKIANQNIPVPRLVPANNPALKTPNTIPQMNTPNKTINPPNGIVRNPSPSLKAEKRPHNKIASNETVDLTDDEPPTKLPGGPKASPAPPVRLVPSQNLMAPQRQPFSQGMNSPRKVYIPISGPPNQALRPGQTIMLKSVPNAGIRPRGPTPRMESMRFNKILSRHPAPLPFATKQYQPPNWKSLPPAPDLKLSKVENGIVISWKIEDVPEDSYEEIASYQLFAYQETSSPASTTLWKKIGDVKALPLPMACTLTQFMAGFKYYFAVRAVDIRSRLGPFSLPGSILLLNKNILD